MNIAIIDADIVGRRRQRFPNLCSMKLSKYYKDLGNNVELKMDYNNLEKYDIVYVSKVFTDTPFPDEVMQMENVICGGTGFFFDKAPPLPDEIEHYMPDYHLYDDVVMKKIEEGTSPQFYEYYLNYSIGMTTRGCIRQCKFCVNQNTNKSVLHSPVSEFYDPSRKKICLYDDNIFACKDWKQVFDELIATGKRFKFQQGMDIRLLNEEKCEAISTCKYEHDFIFAFDQFKDYDIIEKKVDLLRSRTQKDAMFYVLVGFDEDGIYDDDFYKRDILGALKRIELLIDKGCYPYIMKYKSKDMDAGKCRFSDMYMVLSRWCNFKPYIKNLTLNEFVETNSLMKKRLKDYMEFDKELDEKYLNMYLNRDATRAWRIRKGYPI